jgi:hypothetical protein
MTTDNLRQDSKALMPHVLGVTKHASTWIAADDNSNRSIASSSLPVFKIKLREQLIYDKNK